MDIFLISPGKQRLWVFIRRLGEGLHEYPQPVFSWRNKNVNIQWNLSSWNTVGLFTMANLNSFLRPYKILQIALENKYLLNFLILS